MGNDQIKISVKEFYVLLSDEEKSLVRDSLINKFEYSYGTFYYRLRTNTFKKYEAEFLIEQFPELIEKATNTDIN